MTIKTSGIDHIHFNVNHLNKFRDLMEKLFGADITPVAHLAPLAFYNSCISFPGSEQAPFMDVFQAADDSGPVARQIARHGQGVSVVAFRVEDIDQAAQHARSCGLREVSREGYRGMHQVQFDTHEALGFMLELVAYDANFEEQLDDIKAHLRNGETVDGLRYVELQAGKN